MEPRKHYLAKIPTIAIFIVMAMSGPLGVLLFILKGIDQKVQKEEQEAARAQGSTFDRARDRLSHIVVPVGMPLFIGPGSIATVMLYAEKITTFPMAVMMIVMLFLCAAAVGGVLVASRYLFAKIGPNGTQIVIRFMGMILCSIAMQFMIDGVGQLLPGVLDAHFLGGLSK